MWNCGQWKNWSPSSRRLRKGGPQGRALYLHLIIHEQNAPDLEAEMPRLLDAMPPDDQAILELVIRELDAAYGIKDELPN
jgi:hypothetical protein